MSLEVRISRREINDAELERFLVSSRLEAAHKRTFCFLVAYTGCNPTEALTLSIRSVDLAGAAVSFEGADAKPRSIPIPDELVKMFDVIHSVSFIKRELPEYEATLIWDVDRSTASRWVSTTMAAAGIQGRQACARGLRHGFAVRALSAGHSAKTVAYWMGLPVEEVAKSYIR